MFPSIRSINRIPFRKIVPLLMVIGLILFPLLASADEDPCCKTGIYIINLTQIGAWFTRNEGPCTIWYHHFGLNIKPEDALIIYRDLECKTEYFPNNPTYHDYKALDANQDCKVRILLDRTLSDNSSSQSLR